MYMQYNNITCGRVFTGYWYTQEKKTFIICFPCGLALFLSLSRYSDFSCCASIHLYIHMFYIVFTCSLTGRFHQRWKEQQCVVICKMVIRQSNQADGNCFTKNVSETPLKDPAFAPMIQKIQHNDLFLCRDNSLDETTYFQLYYISGDKYIHSSIFVMIIIFCIGQFFFEMPINN